MPEDFATIRQVIAVSDGRATLIDRTSVDAGRHVCEGMYHVLFSDGLEAFILEHEVDVFE